ncbi:alkylhydroperoxidase AhpD family core domain-containing protein [Roseovarius marisflavi]|uniref:Alkylhydroperoxidase AhpD family core domain-containing protein n=1 Tax=Roseovarius marisflavi TaxID=1054996 RepID=A0A1M7DSV0_9RHOB|nr:carboxymuconolactone decarboxylase family protein [Roseovarius marisflavi]SHL82552.1 alkylhydroperoxidase AhpD family core domain-containing protein [Roseovarius marisflavi]
MTMRFNVAKDTPQLYSALLALNMAVAEAEVEPRLIHLIKIRVSQVNGCAFCVGMHVKEAMDDGVEENVLHLLPVWQESSLFNAREKTALSWAETLTMLAGPGVPDAAFGAARAEFSEQELAVLTVAVGTMNLWNRIGVGAQMPA